MSPQSSILRRGVRGVTRRTWLTPFFAFAKRSIRDEIRRTPNYYVSATKWPPSRKPWLGLPRASPPIETSPLTGLHRVRGPGLKNSENGAGPRLSKSSELKLAPCKLPSRKPCVWLLPVSIPTDRKEPPDGEARTTIGLRRRSLISDPEWKPRPSCGQGREKHKKTVSPPHPGRNPPKTKDLRRKMGVQTFPGKPPGEGRQ